MWRLDGREAGSPIPVCVRTFRVMDTKLPDTADEVSVTAVAACEDLTQIAVGLSDGSVLLFRGEFHRDRGSLKRELLQVCLIGLLQATGVGVHDLWIVPRFVLILPRVRVVRRLRLSDLRSVCSRRT